MHATTHTFACARCNHAHLCGICLVQHLRPTQCWRCSGHAGETGMVAQAITDAAIHCKTQKRGRACTSAEATASSFASATATAYADAFASAVDNCDCASRGSVPDAVGSTTFFREFVVEAASYVDASTCIEGTLLNSRDSRATASSPSRGPVGFCMARRAMYTLERLTGCHLECW